VDNTDPELLTPDIGTVQEDVYYRNDYNSTDDDPPDDDDDSTGPKRDKAILTHRHEDVERIFAGLPEAKMEVPVQLEVSEPLDDVGEGDKVESELEGVKIIEQDDESIPVLIPIDNISEA
jgi:hypothetical protein